MISSFAEITFAKYPVFSFNHEVGSRLENEPFERLVDEESTDEYKFNRGYAQIRWKTPLNLKLVGRFEYRLKDYLYGSYKDNDSFTHIISVDFLPIRKIVFNLSFRHRVIDYLNGVDNDNHKYSPWIEFRWKPQKGSQLGIRFAVNRTVYTIPDKNSTLYRSLVWFKHRLGITDFRLRYRVEKVDYDSESSQRKSNWKQGFSFTFTVDPNRTGK